MLVRREMPRKLLAGMLGRLATAVSAGIGIRRAWQMEVARAPAAWRNAMRRVATGLSQGMPLSEAMATAAAAFPPFVREMVAVGESTGHEVETLRDLAEMLEQTLRTARELRRSLAGPAFQLTVAAIVVGFLIFMAGMMSHDVLGIGLRGPRGLAIYAAGLAAAALAAWLLFGMAWANWRRDGVVRRVVDRLPVIGAASRAAEAAAWCRVASLANGVGLGAGRLASLASTAAPGLAVDPREVEERLRSGATLAEAFARTGRFPRPLLEAIAVGEATGNTPEVLDRVAAEFEDEARRGFAAAARGAGFLVWAAVAMLIATLVLRIFSSYVGAIQDAARGL